MKKSIKTFLKTAEKDKIARSANPAIVRASTVYFKTMQEMRQHQKNLAKGQKVAYWDYGRQGSQTTIKLQNILRELEQSYDVFLTQTGFGAVFLSIFSIVRPGDEILIADPVYTPTRILTDEYV